MEVMTNSDQSTRTDPILTASEVAAELRCSKTHIYRLMNGEVEGVSPLPTLALGRKKVVMRSSFEAWKRANEKNRAMVGDESAISAVHALN
jgi:predicted DNA-binding transcriptional regulator AlpA